MTSTISTGPSSSGGQMLGLFGNFCRQPLIELNQSAHNKDFSLRAFYCVHPISGHAGGYYELLARKLNHIVRFYGIQAPQYQMKTSTFGNSVESLVDFYTDALLKAQPTGGFLIGGYSAGALLALEIAQRLRRAHKREVDLLVSIDGIFDSLDAEFQPKGMAYAWGVLRNLPAWTVDALLASETLFHIRFMRSIGRRLRFNWKGHSDNEKVACKARHPVEEFGVYERAPSFLRNFMIRLYDALFAYTHEDYDGEVVVYEAALPGLLSLSSVGRAWHAIARHTKVVRISCKHTTILDEPHISKVANDLTTRLVAVDIPDCNGYASSGENPTLGALF